MERELAINFFQTVGTGHYLCRAGGGGEGGQGCFRQARVRGLFFKQLIGGEGSSFFAFYKGSCLCFCKWARLLLRTKLISKIQMVKMDNI